jgi:cytochrome d ubiquinol oxidase subunit II
VSEASSFWLPLIGAGLIALAVAMYVLVDGFDLGLGILFPLAPSHEARDRMMLSVAPVWDANETWLIVGGAGLFALFHRAYAIVLPGVYIPIVTMLIALVFRGVSFEFRFKATKGRKWWDLAFSAGSLVATLAQGFVLAAFVRGIPTDGRSFIGGAFDWVTPFGVFVALSLACGYALLGATWLVIKTRGDLQAWSVRTASRALVLVALCMAGVSLWMLMLEPRAAARWLSWPTMMFYAPLPILTLAAIIGVWRTLRAGRVHRPFFLSIGIFLLGFAGLAASLFPYLGSPSLTIWQAANTPQSQAFLLPGFAIAIAATLGYNAFAYWVFRGDSAVSDYSEHA